MPQTAPDGFFASVYADYLAYYQHNAESEQRLRTLAPLRMLVNPSLHATILIRLLLASPRPFAFVWRNILIAKHSIDVQRGSVIGAGLMLPHPLGIVLGKATVGGNVLLAHNVTLGAARMSGPGNEQDFPVIGDRVVISPGSIVAGGVRIGADCVIAANCIVAEDMPPGSVFSRGRLRLPA
ncbi:MAG: serine O-acetyltransferase [bacterium]